MNLIKNIEGKYLYKYLPFNQYSLQILINNRFWVGPPDLLNDPFEGDFLIKNCKKIHNAKSIKTLLELTKSSDFHDSLFSEMNQKEMTNDENYFLNKLYEYLNGVIKKNYGTTSFSKNCDNMKMWSHYADSHKGFIIIFDRELLLDSIADGIAKIVDVEYTGLPEIYLESQSNDFIIRDYGKLFTKKLNDWAEEDEVRIIVKNEFKHDFHRFLKFKRQCLKGIVYGSRISFENLQTIDNTLKDLHKGLKFYIAKKNSTRSKIIFSQIDYKN